jgi:hypothetical protein
MKEDEREGKINKQTLKVKETCTSETSETLLTYTYT